MFSFLNSRSAEKLEQLDSSSPAATGSPPTPASTVAHTRHLVLVKSEEQVVSDFNADLEAALKDVEAAFAQSKKSRQEIEKLRESLQTRGWWGTVKGTFDASTDKELATQILALGSSVELTLAVVRVMLQVQTQKNKLLQRFNQALVNKIANIEGDTRTLDDNQKIAALEFLGELHQQIEEQILQQELVQDHERQIQAHEQRLFEVEDGSVESNRQAAHLLASTEDLKRQVAEHGQWRVEKEQRDAAMHQQLVNSARDISDLKQLAANLEARLTTLEDSNRVHRSFKAALTRQLLPLIAVGLAMISLFFSRITG
ncbi:hypothetical protein ACSFBX_10375 [Variovorax sp. RB2P76]|uniref:hypothetical protein n=1 Tax=Variovorax sp. RB2P76 TaxID=3443736 RepID=UPI003F463834